MAQERPFYDALMQFAGVTDTSQPLSLDARAKIGAELTDLARVAANLTTDRERSAVKSYIAERKREFDLAKTRADLIQELRVLDKNLAADRANAALSAREKAAKYIAETENKLYRPDMARVQGALLGAQSAMDILQRLVGDPILESTEGVLSKDETVYARLRRFGQQYPTLFRLEGSRVIPGAQLGTVNQATVQALKDRVAQTYDAFRLLEESVARSKAVEAEMERIQRDADAEIDRSVINPAVASLGDVQLRAQPKQIGEDIRRAREELEKGDRELARIDRAEKTLRGMLENADQDAVRAAFAKAVNNPFFQQWAESNGFDIGTSDGTAGSYRAGRDDVEAAALFALQERTGMRLAKRRGRTVALPEEFVEVEQTDLLGPSAEERLTEEQRYVRDSLARVEGKEIAPFKVTLKDGSVQFLIKDERPGSEDSALLQLNPDGTVRSTSFEEVAGIAESTPEQATLSDFAVAVGKMNRPASRAKEATRRSGQVYTEIRLTPEDLRQRRRRLLDEETGEVIEVPLDTKLDVLEDIRVPLTRKIGQRADERFFARQKRKADRELLREEELPRPPERTDMEEEAVPDVEGLPEVTEELEESLSGPFGAGFDIDYETGAEGIEGSQVDLRGTPGKRDREIALRRAANVRKAGALKKQEERQEREAEVRKLSPEEQKALAARGETLFRTRDPGDRPGTIKGVGTNLPTGEDRRAPLAFKFGGQEVSYDPKNQSFVVNPGENERVFTAEDSGLSSQQYKLLQKGLAENFPQLVTPVRSAPPLPAPAPAPDPAPQEGPRIGKLRKMARRLRSMRKEPIKAAKESEAIIARPEALEPEKGASKTDVSAELVQLDEDLQRRGAQESALTGTPAIESSTLAAENLERLKRRREEQRRAASAQEGE